MPLAPLANPLSNVDVLIDSDIDLTAFSDLSYDNRPFNSNATIRALIIGKSNHALNGIYTSTAGTSAWTRAADADSYAELVGASVTVDGGDVYGPRQEFPGTSWFQKGAENAGTLGRDPIDLIPLAMFLDDSTEFASWCRIYGNGTDTHFVIAHPHNTQLTTPTFTTSDGLILYPTVVKVGFSLDVTFASPPDGGGAFVLVSITSPVIDFN